MSLSFRKTLLLMGACAAMGAIPTMQANAASPTGAANVVQQQKNVKGVINDSFGPVVGATVMEKGTSNGTVTDVDGNFSLNVNPGATLVVSYIGFATQEIVVGNQSTLSILLQEDNTSLEEVVVVGYGVQKKKLVTGATVEVKGEDIAKLNTTQVLGALQSQSPGVSIQANSGQPGDGFKIAIRGAGTNGDTKPLYVIDGVSGGDIFQLRFMKPVVNYIIRKKCDGISFDESALPRDKSLRYTFVSNHRDIVLDSAFLDILLVKNGYPTTVEIGIGDNLLIYPWIKRLVRMNKAFVVRRSLTPHEMIKSSQLMSQYIHYAVNEKNENIWIAQREGRAKDSDDRTQESVLKMLAMGGKGNFAEQLSDLNIVPLTISYEFDPCDYLKAKEFQQKRDNPRYKKSRQDDLDNMRVGIFGFKGHVHYHCAAPVNTFMNLSRLR